MASLPLSGKVALITGGSKGIGASTALELSSQGAKVVINYASDSKPAEELVQKIGAENAIAIKADAGDVQEIERLVQETVQKWGKIDILHCNAASMIMRDVASTTEADFDNLYRVNVKGPYFLVQKALPYLAPGSHVILTSTSLNAASTVAPGYLLYCSTKGAIEQMTRILAKDLARKGISVNAIAPGPTATELFFKGKNQQTLDLIASYNPYNRLGTPEDIAKAIGFLAGEKSAWVNGQILRVNGGMTVG